MTFDAATDNLFLGLRADYELNEEEVSFSILHLNNAMNVFTTTFKTTFAINQLKRELDNAYRVIGKLSARADRPKG